MALRTQRGGNIPENVVVLSENEALAHQRALLRDWPSETEVFTLKYGSYVGSITSTASSFLIASYLKRALFIQKKAVYLSIFIPSIVMPATFSYYFGEKHLNKNILLMKLKCPLCEQIKYAACQYFTGIVYPSLLAYFAFSSFVTLPGLKTYNMPDFKTHPKEFWITTFKIFRNGSRTFQVVGMLNTAAIFIIPYLQSKQLANIYKKIDEKKKNANLEEFQSDSDQDLVM